MVGREKLQPLARLSDDVGEEEAYLENDYSPGDDALEKLYASLGSSDSTLKISLYRAQKDSRKQAYLCAIEAADFSLDDIKRRFGGGDFIVKGYDEKSKLRINQTVTIEGEPVSPVATLPLPVLAPAPLDLGTLAKMLHENTQTMLSGLAQILTPTPHPSRADFLQELVTMRSIFSSDVPRESGIDNIMKGIELAKSIAPRDGDTTGMDVLLETIKSFGPAVGQVIAQSTKANTHRNILPKPDNGQLKIAPPIPEKPAESNESQEDIMFKYYLQLLVSYAAQDKDPQLYADLIADNLPEEKLLEICSNENIIADLIKINPDVAKYEIWFNAVIMELKLIMGLTDDEINSTVNSLSTGLSEKNAPSDITNGHDGDVTGTLGG